MLAIHGERTAFLAQWCLKHEQWTTWLQPTAFHSQSQMCPCCFPLLRVEQPTSLCCTLPVHTESTIPKVTTWSWKFYNPWLVVNGKATSGYWWVIPANTESIQYCVFDHQISIQKWYDTKCRQNNNLITPTRNNWSNRFVSWEAILSKVPTGWYTAKSYRPVISHRKSCVISVYHMARISWQKLNHRSVQKTIEVYRTQLAVYRA